MKQEIVLKYLEMCHFAFKEYLKIFRGLMTKTLIDCIMTIGIIILFSVAITATGKTIMSDTIFILTLLIGGLLAGKLAIEISNLGEINSMIRSLLSRQKTFKRIIDEENYD